MNVELRVHDLQNDLKGTKNFETVEAAKHWLVDRPKFVEVTGVNNSRDLSKELNRELRSCMRGLDDEEQQLKQELHAKEDEAARARAKANIEEEAEYHRAQMAAADPNRPMNLSYRHGEELVPSDVADTREISAEVREAVMAWVAERNTWVERRSQVVGVANVKVWPGPIPEGQDERVIEGSFVPVAN
jgi:hypothetical protein